MIGDSNSSLKSQNFDRIGDERTSCERAFECAGFMIEFECTVDKEVA